MKRQKSCQSSIRLARFACKAYEFEINAAAWICTTHRILLLEATVLASLVRLNVIARTTAKWIFDIFSQEIYWWAVTDFFLRFIQHHFCPPLRIPQIAPSLYQLLASTVAFAGFTSRDLRPCYQVYLFESHVLIYSPQE